MKKDEIPSSEIPPDVRELIKNWLQSKSASEIRRILFLNPATDDSHPLKELIQKIEEHSSNTESSTVWDGEGVFNLKRSKDHKSADLFKITPIQQTIKSTTSKPNSQKKNLKFFAIDLTTDELEHTTTLTISKNGDRQSEFDLFVIPQDSNSGLESTRAIFALSRSTDKALCCALVSIESGLLVANNVTLKNIPNWARIELPRRTRLHIATSNAGRNPNRLRAPKKKPSPKRANNLLKRMKSPSRRNAENEILDNTKIAFSFPSR